MSLHARLPAWSEIVNSLRQPALLRADLLAGITVGLVAVPLSMALAIAVGVAPQHGLYTAVIAGVFIALFGGSRFSISGPTAAFVVVLLPITHQYGMGGLLLAGGMAGVILIVMGAAGLGRLIEIVPYPVTVGFTSGIAVVIASLQIKDFFGLDVAGQAEHFFGRLWLLILALPSLRWADLLVASSTLLVLLVWPRWRSRIPAPLVALSIGSLMAVLITWFDPNQTPATIGSRFSFQLADGQTGQGIPPLLPQWLWPWELTDAQSQPMVWSFQLFQNLLGPAFAIAMLGALESLLCAVVADSMSGTRHKPNQELIGQGIGNLLAPLFGGIPATAAIARTAANIRAGAVSPLAAMTHAGFVLLSIVLFAPLLAYLPMAALASLLLIVAWNMSEARHFLRILRVAPRSDVLVLLVCFGLTVVFDMTIAVAVGMGLAAGLFIKRSIDFTASRFTTKARHAEHLVFPEQVVIYDVDGPLFFGAAQKALRSLVELPAGKQVVILDMHDVSMLDMTAMVALESIFKALQQRQIRIIVQGLQPRMILKLRRVGLRRQRGRLEFARNSQHALDLVSRRDDDSPAIPA